MMKQTAGRDNLGELAPKFAELNDDVLFGEIWSRDEKLSLRDRSMITISALMAQGLFPQLKSHIIMGKKHGITKEEVVEMVTQLAFYTGWAKAWSTFPIIEEVYKDNTMQEKHGGQVLICVEGEGWYQEEGKKAQSLKAGDIITIPANIKHWHGAKADSWFSHIAVEVPGENTSNEWLEPVKDEEYDKL